MPRRSTAQVLDRRRIEALSAQAQRQADEREAIFTSLVEPAMVFDTTGAILRANPAAQEWLGVDPVGLPEAVLSQKMSARYPDGRPIPADQLVAVRALRGERVRDDYQFLVTPSGERAIVASAAPIVTDGQCRRRRDKLARHHRPAACGRGAARQRGETAHAVRSVAHWRRRPGRRAQGRASEPRLGEHGRPLAMGSWPLDPESKRLPPARRHAHCPPDELPSARALREQRLVQGEVGIVTDDGSVIWQEVNAVPVPFGDWKAVVTVADVTERKRAEEAVRRARDELEHRVRERTTELESANQKLLAEIRQRMRVEGELRLSEQRLEQRVEERTRVLTSLLDISNTVALSIDLEALLALILERLKGRGRL